MPRIVVFLAASLSALFVLWLGSQMPEMVASHFSVSGNSDSHLPRSSFVPLFAVLCAALPTFVWWLQVHAVTRGKMKIPNAQYWFAPPENDRTQRFLVRHAAWFSSLLAAFLCYVFWLVFQANSSDVASKALNTQAFFIGLLAFLVLTAVWLYALHARFGRKDA